MRLSLTTSESYRLIGKLNVFFQLQEFSLCNTTVDSSTSPIYLDMVCDNITTLLKHDTQDSITRVFYILNGFLSFGRSSEITLVLVEELISIYIYIYIYVYIYIYICFSPSVVHPKKLWSWSKG